MKLDKSIIVFTLLVLSLLNLHAITPEEDATKQQEKTGIELITSQYEWKDFWAEFDVSPTEFGFCPTKDPKKNLFGMRTTMIEPLYLVDVTVYNNKSNSVGATIGKLRPDKQGINNEGGGTYVNVWKFPLMNMLFKNTKNNIFYFEKGNVKLVYLGALDPKKWNDILAISLSPEKALFSNFVGMLAAIPSCAANTVLDTMSPKNIRTSSVGKSLRYIIDTFYYANGCNGVVPTGTISLNENPIITAKLSLVSVLSDMHSKKGIVNSLEVANTVQSTLNGNSKKILCHPVQNLLLPQTQYKVQVLSPSVGPQKELGVGGLAYSFRSSHSTGKTVQMVLSQRRDYYSFAYSGAAK